jgi:hypothetical protein
MPTKKTASKKSKSKAPVAPAVAPAAPPVITAVANDANNSTKEAVELSYQTLNTGLLANYAPTYQFTIDGALQTAEALVGVFQKRIAAAEATKAAKTAYHGAVQAERQADLVARPLRAGLETHFQAELGKTSPKLTTYGFEPRKVAVRTAAEKAEAQQKAAATRAAGGKKAKKKSTPTEPSPAK